MLKSIYSVFHRHYHRKYHGIYNHAKQLFIFDLGLLALSIFMMVTGIFFFIWKPGIAEKVPVQISVGESRIKSGDEMRITVDYSNNSKVTVKSPTLSLRLPTGFVVDRTKTPENIFSDNTFPLKDLPPGGKGTVEVYGTNWANVGDEERLFATLSFKQENKSYEEQSIGTYLLSLSDSVLSGNIIVATSSFANKELPVKYILKNDGENDISGITIISSPQTIKMNENVNITLKPGEEKILTGTVVTPKNSNKILLSLTPSVLINRQIFKQKTSGAMVNLYEPLITIRSRFPSSPAFAEAKMNLPLEITWKNDDGVSLKNQRIRVSPTPGTVDYTSTLRDNRITRSGNDLIIDERSRTLLGTGSSSGETFTLNLKLAPTFSLNESQTNFTVQPVFEAEMDGISDQTYSIFGNTISMPFLTEAKLYSEARYYTDDGDQLGRGPLPPEVGETTKYWIFTTLSNTTNPLESAKLTISLAPGVQFTGKQSVSLGPQLKYDSSARTISWQLPYDLIPAFSQTGIYFEVAVTPTSDQVGKTIPLVNEAVFTAKDSRINKDLKLRNSAITNRLGESDLGAERGASVVFP